MSCSVGIVGMDVEVGTGVSVAAGMVLVAGMHEARMIAIWATVMIFLIFIDVFF